MHCAIVSRFKPIRAVLRQLLTSIDPGLRVHEAAHLEEMVAAVGRDAPLRLLFVSMPSSTEQGMSALTQIRSQYPDIRLVVMASYDFPEYRQLEGSMGINHIISHENMTRQAIEQIIHTVKPAADR